MRQAPRVSARSAPTPAKGASTTSVPMSVCQFASSSSKTPMKLHFEPNLDYQLQAVESVCDLFRGQEACRTEFTVTMRSGRAEPANDLFPGTVPQQLTLGI